MTPSLVLAAANRLRGHLVRSPLIGTLPAAEAGGCDVRWLADLVQPGGSGWFRGYQHVLLRSQGQLPGVTFAGPTVRFAAAAVAAVLHRLPFVGFIATLDPVLQEWAERLGARLECAEDPAAAARELQRRRGYLSLPGVEHPDIAAGLATAGLDLASGLPNDCSAVYAPADVAGCIAAGLSAGNRPIEVIGVADAGDPLAARVRAQIERGHRLLLSPGGVTVLTAASRHGAGPVGAIVLE